jgi:hypothetical protein
MKTKLILIFLTTFFFTGCRYKEGPIISFRSVEKRLIGTWQITELTSDGIDSLKYYNDSCGAKMKIWKESYDESVSKILLDGKKKLSGTCFFDKKKQNLTVSLHPTYIIGPLNNLISYWVIQKLTFRDFKVKTNVYGKDYIISFKKL